MTNIIVENCAKGTPSDSTVVFAGQSHISSGMIVLGVIFRQAATMTAEPQNRLYSVLRYAHCCLEIERLIGWHVVEEKLLDGCFSSSAELSQLRGKIDRKQTSGGREGGF